MSEMSQNYAFAIFDQ